MAGKDCMAQLGGWDGYLVRGWKHELRGDQRWVVIDLEPDRFGERICSGCDTPTMSVHDRSLRKIRDLPVFGDPVELHVPRLRVLCPSCGPRLEQLAWLEAHARVTRRLAENVARLCAVTSVLHAARFFGLGWKAVKNIDFAHLERTLGPIDLSGITVLGMDEFAIQKGHRYATVIVEPTRKRVLWIGRGRGRDDVRPFFELLGADGCKAIEAVVMDMNAAFEQEVRAQCPNAKIIFDLFHVVAKYSREVIDRVRVDEANRVRSDPRARRVVKTARWILLRNRDTLTDEQEIHLDELLAANKALFTVYVLKDDLKTLWRYRHSGYARRFWARWLRRAMRSGIKPLQVFAQRLKPYLPGILAHCRWPLGTNLIEGINNKIKVIKRMAYGFRDDAYFFLKIRAAFPGVGR